MKTLLYIIEQTKYSLSYNRDVYGQTDVLALPVEDIVYNSTEARPNTVFFCIVGSKADGHNFAEQAYEKGVKIFVCERVLPLPDDAVQVVVENSRISLAKMSANFFGHPEKKLKIIGVTGTKGKSSVCEMISHIFSSVNRQIATIGTIGIKIAGKTEPTENSTPESYILYKNFAKMVELGIEYVAMEVSSQAVYMGRIHGIEFDAAIVTNLYEDHIGPSEHPNFEHYKSCKKELLCHAKYAFINADDAYSDEFAESAVCEVRKYGIEKDAEVCAQNIENFKAGNIFGISFDCVYYGKTTGITLPVPGKFSVYNALAAICVCRYFGVSVFDAAHALETVSIKGRFEIVPTSLSDVTCIIDYAHNGKSLMHVLSTIREYEPSRVICVFGSVGGRTKHRRREMALAAGELADICIITSDNPDNEPISEIIDEIAEDIPPEKCIKIPDRAEAIYRALEMAGSGDFILFAGKGHEEYQLVNGKKLFFSEKETIRASAQRIGAREEYALS